MLMKNIFILLSILIIFTVCSCKNNNSLLSQITASTSDCSVNEEQAFYYYEKYGKNNPNITVDYGNTTGDDRINVIKKAFKVLSNVAEEYLETAFKTYNISVNIITKKTVEKYDGLTLLIYKDANSTMISHPKHIEYSTFEVLIHEFGHVSEILPQNKYSNFSYDLTDLANTISDTEKSLYLRHYNNSSQDPKDRETFAELFDTWYCSKAARNNLKLQIPDAYKFAKQYLLPPIGEVSEQQNTSDSDSLFVEIKQDTKTYQEIIDIVKNSKPNLNPSNCSSQKQGSIYVVKDNTTNLIWTDVITSPKDYFGAKQYCETLKMNNLKFRLPTFEEIVEAYDKGCLKTTGKAFWTDSIPYINNQAMYVYQPATSYSNSFKVSTKENSFVFSCVSY